MAGPGGSLTSSAGCTSLRTEPEEADFSEDLDPVKFWQGLEFYIGILSSHEETRDRVPDVLAWKSKVSEFKNALGRMKVLYMKEFMYKYRGAAEARNWCDKFETDISLMTQYLSPWQGDRQPRHQERGGRQPYNKRPRGREDQLPRREAPYRRRPDDRQRPRHVGVCYSRSDPAHGECPHANCRFDHKCASCGSDHAAAKCPRFDPAKIRRRPGAGPRS